MKLYLVNNKYYFNDLSFATEKAKEIVRSRYFKKYSCNELWKITQGKHNGFCVKCEDDWYKVGNIHYLQVAIKTIITED